MRNIKLTIQYDGTNYSGWQSQRNSLAVQDVIEKAIKKVTGERLRITGAGRTDANVHAAGQVASFRTRTSLPLIKIKKGINKNLPQDVVIIRTTEVSDDFHSQFDAKTKLYRYKFYTDKPVSPFLRNFVVPVIYELDIDLMRMEAKDLLGRHDFIAFQGSNSPRKDTVRSVRRISIKKRGKIVEFDIEGDGFLYNMVRTIVGTLIDIGRGRFGKGTIKRILTTRDRRLVGWNAPAKGLCLIKVTY